MELKDILSEKEVGEIQRFLDNELLKEAVKKCLLFGVYGVGSLEPGLKSTPTKNFALSFVNGWKGNEDNTDEMIGRKLRAAYEAISYLEGSFKEMENLKKHETINLPNKNNAR